MNRLLGILTLSLISFSSGAGDQPPEAPAAVLQTLLQATQDNNLEAFESVCDDVMKQTMTPELLKEVSDQLAGLLQAGYQTIYMGVLDRINFKTYFWKLDLSTEGASDVLAELSLKEGKAVGFFLK